MSWNEYRHFSQAHGADNTADGLQATLTVSSLMRMAKSLLESNFPSVLVEGEISNLSMPSSGHWYFSLKDKNSQLRCAMFANRNRRVRFKPENGNQILLKGKISLYEGRGDFQLIADDMEDAGDGALSKAFAQLKAKLHEEGLFDASRKKVLPPTIGHVAVITSASGAAFHDIITVFERRFPAISITLLPVLVQGSDAATSIVSAITKANKLADQLNIHALLVGRGGGSLEDLQAFNDEAVARAIADSNLPVVSAVGHETDFTIADFVADLRAATPSAAAELLSPDQQEYLQSAQRLQQKFIALVKRTLEQNEKQLSATRRRLIHPGRILSEHTQTLDRLENRAKRAANHHLKQQRAALAQLRLRLSSQSPEQTLNRFSHNLLQLQHRLTRSIDAQLKSKTTQLAQLGRSLHGVSPLNTLARGYSITRLAEAGATNTQAPLIRRSADVKKGDRIRSLLQDGQVISVVESTADT